MQSAPLETTLYLPLKICTPIVSVAALQPQPIYFKFLPMCPLATSWPNAYKPASNPANTADLHG